MSEGEFINSNMYWTLPAARAALTGLFLAGLMHPLSAAAQTSSSDVPIWQGLAHDMSPEQAAAVVATIGGVKSAKTRGKPGASGRLSIQYKDGGLPIGDIKYTLAPVFEDDHLKQVVLLARDQCASEALKAYQALSAALVTKYPHRQGFDGLDEDQLASAKSEARASRERATRTYFFSSDKVAVLVSFLVSVEAPPAYPASFNKLILSIYQLARTQYDNRRAECSGTGNERADIGIQYLTLDDFHSKLNAAAKANIDKQGEMAKGL